jgi:hypothetical protein
MLAIRFRFAQQLGGGRMEGAIHAVVLTEGKKVAPGTSIGREYSVLKGL